MSSRALSTYRSAAINEALIGGILGEAYESPFPQGAGAALGASMVGVIHLLLLPLLGLSMLISVLRPARNGRLFLAVGLAGRAWFLLFMRGLLGIHAGDAVVLPLSLGLSAVLVGCLVLHHRRSDLLPRLPPRRRFLGRFRAWLVIVAVLFLMLFSALLVRVFMVQTLAFMAVALGYGLWSGGGTAAQEPA